MNHIAGYLKSALVGKSMVELYCDLDGLLFMFIAIFGFSPPGNKCRCHKGLLGFGLLWASGNCAMPRGPQVAAEDHGGLGGHVGPRWATKGGKGPQRAFGITGHRCRWMP
jgi:hypothetical protein